MKDGSALPEEAQWFRDQLASLGMNQARFIRFLLDHGDDRGLATVQRQVSRMANGGTRVSSEMRVILRLAMQQITARGGASSSGAHRE